MAQTAKVLFIFFIGLLIIAFIADQAILFIYKDDVVTETYLLGHYVSTMPADASSIIGGYKDRDLLYSNEDILNEVENYAFSTYYGMSENTVKIQRDDAAGTIYMRFYPKIQLIKYIDVLCNIVYYKGEKGIETSVVYYINSRADNVGFFGVPVDLPEYPISATKRFRIGV